MGRPINNGKNFKATVTSTGLVISAASDPAAAATGASAGARASRADRLSSGGRSG
jgi:hypothetical protein